MEIFILFHRITTWLMVFVTFSVDFGIAVESTWPSQTQFDRLHTEEDCEFPNISDLKLGEYHLMSTSKFNVSFAHTIGKLSSSNTSMDDPLVTYVEIDRRSPFKLSEFLGFGCTFTDSDLEILQKLPATLVDRVFENYFSANGLNFELLRVPVDGNFEAKRKIYSERQLGKQLKLVAVFRRENFDSPSEFRSNVTNSTGTLLKLVKSMNDENENKIEMIQLDFDSTEQAPNVTDQANQIQKLITSFNRSTAAFVTPKICLTDSTRRIEQPWLFELEKSHENIFNRFDMISLTNRSVPPEFLCRAYKKYQKPIIFEEIKDVNGVPTVETDLWQTAEELIGRIMSLLHQNIVGFLGHSLNSLITFDENEAKFSKHPAFYAIAHFSRHILPHSKRIAATLCGPMMASIQTVAYLRPDGKILVLLYNLNDISIAVTVVDKRIGTWNITLSPKSIHSIVYCI